ncbi:MAG: HAMP domain-containing sensor histidine kinase, partial [Clostridia bacterium]
MISTLRKKLALLLISVIATVVLCTTAAALIVSEHQLNLGERVRFNAQVDQVVQEVRMAGIMRAAQLAKVEVAYDLIIAISDGGGLAPFRGGWQPLTDRRTLVKRAMASVPDVAERWDGTVMGDHNERYLAAVCRIGGYRSVRTVIMLEDMQKDDAQRHSQRLMYAGIALLALIVLSLFCWFFTNRAMRPIQDAYNKQNQFVVAASHELRTPLQVIRTATDALKLNPLANAFFTAQIDEELSHMSKLTEDLLLLAAAPNWKTVKGDPVEADIFIRNALNHHRAAAAQKEVALTLYSSPEPLPLLEGNELMLQRALHVLIDNAVC